MNRSKRAVGTNASWDAAGAEIARGAPALASARPDDSPGAVPMVRGEGMATFYLRGTPGKLESDPLLTAIWAIDLHSIRSMRMG